MQITIKDVHNLESLLIYMAENLNWDIEVDNFDIIEDFTYDFEAADIGLKDEEFSKVEDFRQLRPIFEGQPFGVFSVDFGANKLEITSLRKILSGLIPRRKNQNHAVWDKDELIFLCFWGTEPNRTVGLVQFEDVPKGLPIIKAIYCAPRVEEQGRLQAFISKLDYFQWPANPEMTSEWKYEWKKAFTKIYRTIISDSQALTELLVAETNKIKNNIYNELLIEDDNGSLHRLFAEFRSSIIHHMTEDDFADMYAQTIVYGLFSAKCLSEGTDFSPEIAVERIPKTNPFLKNLLRCFLEKNGEFSYDVLDVVDLIELLSNTDINAILEDFNRQTGNGKEDPILYFYEGFLKKYNREQQEQEGVFYTPKPIVEFMISIVDTILREKIKIEDGLCSENLEILDPAAGTGTYLRDIILKIYDSIKDKSEVNWNTYVSKSLLNHIYGFEQRMAPYAIAHLKLALTLYETGYDFSGDDRIHVFLTNSLENPDEYVNEYGNPLFVEEAKQCGIVKNEKNIRLVICNPPYNTESRNKGQWITDLMETYKKEPGTDEKLNERNPKVINNDYVKFTRMAQNMVANTDAVVAFINPNSFLDNLTFRGMRWSLLNFYDEIYILDLHGNIMARETSEDGHRDENIFDNSTQGISINFYIKKKEKTQGTLAKVYYFNMYGTRLYKHEQLRRLSFHDINWKEINVLAPNYFFVEKDYTDAEVYQSGMKLSELFPEYLGGVKTHDDANLVSDNAYDTEYDNLYDYRPFEIKHINYDCTKVKRNRFSIMKNFIGHENYGFVMDRQVVADNWSHVQIVRNIVDNRIHYSNRGIPVEAPMYLYDEDEKKHPNVNMEYVKSISDTIGQDFNTEMKCQEGSFNMLDLYDYVYAILHNPSYREKYMDFLKTDFPIVPYPVNNAMFKKCCSFGARLRKLHLMETDLDCSRYDFPIEGDNIVGTYKFKNDRLYINKNQFFVGVEELEWNSHFGGYCPAQKWLKDKRGQKLAEEDIIFYMKVLATLRKNEEIMHEIDNEIIL